MNLFVAIIAATCFYELFYPTHKVHYDLASDSTHPFASVVNYNNTQDHGRQAEGAVFASYIPYSHPLSSSRDLPPPPPTSKDDYSPAAPAVDTV